jgi:hypothetical protein
LEVALQQDTNWNIHSQMSCVLSVDDGHCRLVCICMTGDSGCYISVTFVILVAVGAHLRVQRVLYCHEKQVGAHEHSAGASARIPETKGLITIYE